MKKLLSVLIILILIVAAIFFLWPKSKASSFQTATVTKGTISDTVVATGQIVPVRAVQVKSQISGTVGKILVKEGDLVKAGQLLAVINPAATPNSLAQAISQLDQDRASYLQAKQDYQRNQTLLSEHLIAQAAFDKTEQLYEVAQAKFHLSQQNLQLLQQGKATIGGRLIQNSVISPVSGYVLKIAVNEGDMITPSTDYMAGTPLFILADMNNLVFRGEVTQLDVGKLKVGMPVQLQLAAVPNLDLQGQITLIALQSNQAESQQNSLNGTGVTQLFSAPTDIQDGFAIEVKGFAIPKDVTLRAGYEATADIQVKKLEDALLVPQTALNFENGQAYVLLPGPNNSAQQQKVMVGITDNQNAEIVSGLKAGQAVIVGS